MESRDGIAAGLRSRPWDCYSVEDSSSKSPSIFPSFFVTMVCFNPFPHDENWVWQQFPVYVLHSNCPEKDWSDLLDFQLQISREGIWSVWLGSGSHLWTHQLLPGAKIMCLSQGNCWGKNMDGRWWRWGNSWKRSVGRRGWQILPLQFMWEGELNLVWEDLCLSLSFAVLSHNGPEHCS